MADSDETMLLAAEIVNKWSGPLTDMRRDLRKLADDVKGTHAAGVTHAKKHGDAISGVRREFQRLDEHVKSTSLQTMAAFGLSAIGVASAVSSVKDAVFGFGDSTRQLTFLRRETGLAIDQLRQYEALARRVGAAPGAMSKGIQDFAQHMQDIRRLAPAELNAWATGFDRNANQFVRSLARMSNPEALSAAIGFLDRIPSVQDKRKWLRMLGLPEDLANVPVAELRKQMGEIQKSIGNVGPDAEKSALKFEAAIDRMNDSIEKLKLTVGSELADAFSDATDQIREFVEENRDGLMGVLKDVSSGIHTALKDARELMQVYRELRGGEMGPSLKKFLGEKDVDAVTGGLDWLSKHSGQGQRLWDQLQKPSNVPPGADFMPMAYHPGGLRSGGGYSMVGAGAPSGSPEEVIAKGTHAGVLQALRDFRAEVEGSSTGAGGAGGMMAANYSPGGGVGGGGGISGSLRRSLGGSYVPSGAGNGAGGPLRSEIGSGETAPTPAASGPGLAADRARFAQELAQKPWLKNRIMQISLGENNDPRANLAVMESIFNRASARGTSLEEATRQYTGPGSKGYYPGSTFAGGARSMRIPKYLAMAQQHWEQVMGGSNISNFATDNSSNQPGNNLAWRDEHSGRFNPQSLFNGEHFFSPGPNSGRGPASMAAYRAWLARVGQGGIAGQSGSGVWAAPGYTAEMYSPYGLHGEALRKHFGYRGHSGALGKQSGIMGQGGQLKGSAHLAIDVRGMPKGWRTKLAHSGFSEVRLNRGHAMVPASQDG